MMQEAWQQSMSCLTRVLLRWRPWAARALVWRWRRAFWMANTRAWTLEDCGRRPVNGVTAFSVNAGHAERRSRDRPIAPENKRAVLCGTHDLAACDIPNLRRLEGALPGGHEIRQRDTRLPGILDGLVLHLRV